MSALLSPWTGRHSKGEGCCEKKQEVERKRGRSWGMRGLVCILPFKICRSAHTLCLFWNERCFKRALVFVHGRRTEGGLPPCAGIEAENFQRFDVSLAFVLKVR